MTNFERWQAYTSGLSSPQSYIDWSWLYLVGAALQRRCWLGPAHQPCFANKYVIFVGEPGIGKGLPIREVSLFLKHWKKKDRAMPNMDTLAAQQKQSLELSKSLSEEKIQQEAAAGKEILTEPPLYPVAADATTYEALVKAVADSYSRIEYINPDDPTKFLVQGHSSLCFCLQELASLMRKKTEDTVNYMLGLYDCPVDYEYDTKTKGKDRIRRGCLNMLAGTTPGFMQSTFDDKLADEGFNSRTFYIFANKNRKNQFFIPPLTKEQEAHRTHLLEHIRQLSALYGNVKIDQETEDFLQTWWDEQEKNKHKRSNTSPKLKPYYSRRNIHVMKIAMALHFGESVEMSIPLETFMRAISVLEREEVNMHMAIVLDSKNPIAKVTAKIIELLGMGEMNYVDLSCETHSLANKDQLTEALDYLGEQKQIEAYQVADEDGETKTTYWRLKK